MAYTVPPTFASGTKVTSTDLNTLSDDISYLKQVLQKGGR